MSKNRSNWKSWTESNKTLKWFQGLTFWNQARENTPLHSSWKKTTRRNIWETQRLLPIPSPDLRSLKFIILEVTIWNYPKIDVQSCLERTTRVLYNKNRLRETVNATDVNHFKNYLDRELVELWDYLCSLHNVIKCCE